MKKAVSFLVFALLAFDAWPAASAQSNVPTATSLLQASLLNLTAKGAPVKDLTMRGSVEYTAGSTHDSGSVVLKANNAGNTSMKLVLPSGVRGEIHTVSKGSIHGSWKGGKGVHTLALRNLVVEPNWFAPELFLSDVSNPSRWTATATSSPAGSQGAQMKTILLVRNSSPKWRAFVARYGVMRMTFRGQLPISLEYHIYPVRSSFTPIKVRIIYSDYQSACGHLMPFHISRYFNGFRQLSISIDTVACNTGLQVSAFVY